MAAFQYVKTILEPPPVSRANISLRLKNMFWVYHVFQWHQTEESEHIFTCIYKIINVTYRKPFNDRVQTLLSYLDIYFGSDALVEHAPNSNQKHLRKTWKEFYQEDYLPWCTVNNEIPIPRNLFNSIRKHQRPHYVKSSKMRKRGFDVTSCSTCDTFEVLEAKCKDAEDYRKIRNAHEGHMGKATAHRRHYASTRTKATTVINRNSDIDRKSVV